MKQILILSTLLAFAACSPQAKAPAAASEPTATTSEACIPEGYDRAKLEMLKAGEFEIADEAERETFAKAITACLASPDPKLRDGVAYEALMHMLREKQLSAETMKALLADLQPRLEGPDGEGFERPFAALALSEIARADRIEPFLTEDELMLLVVKAQAYLLNVYDYRGFHETEGWRHGVAHGADLLMQLALNPRVDNEGLGLIVSAIGVQIAPRGHSYIFGESERLAQPVLFAASRGVMREQEWSAWLKQVVTPPADVADRLSTSVNGLAWRHNTKAFLDSLYLNVTLGSDKADDVMLPGLEAALKAIP
jgi:hypothetical protein